MEDLHIIKLYFERSEKAIFETKKKYGAFLNQIVYNILREPFDSEEIVNDILLSAWNSIPPTKPISLKHYLSRIARNLAFNRLDYKNAKCRNSHSEILLSELEECISDENRDGQSVWEAKLLGDSLNVFLGTLNKTTCAIFLSRYYYCLTIKEIAEKYQITERHVKYVLKKTREQLRIHLRKDGINV